MKRPLSKKRAASLALFTAILAAVWVLPPVVHRARHLCPVRPDGVDQAAAVPAFARKYGFSCMQCHSNWPTLNAYGRQFKLNGYVPSRDSEDGVLKSADGLLWVEKNFPLSVIVRSRPLDVTKGASNSTKMQAIYDTDFFFAGGDAAHHVSWFGEMDANADSGFSPLAMADLQLGYNPSDYLNLVVARRGFYVMDPFQTLTNFGSPTIANRGISGGQQVDSPLSAWTMDQTAQTVAGYGEVGNDGVGYLYYAAGVTAQKDSDAGIGGDVGNVRLAYDTSRGLVFGTFGSWGYQGLNTNASAAPADRTEIRRTGVDMLLEHGPATARAAFMYGEDKDVAPFDATYFPNGDKKQTDRAAYAEAQYVIRRGDSQLPFLVPLVRANWYTTNNGKDQFSYVTAQLSHYFAANLKSSIEYMADLKQDITGSNTVRDPKGTRVTASIELGF